MFKVQYRSMGAGLWNLAALPTSLQMALGSARVIEAHEQPSAIRIVPGGLGVGAPQHLLDFLV
jgi:hypothetical protein